MKFTEANPGIAAWVDLLSTACPMNTQLSYRQIPEFALNTIKIESLKFGPNSDSIQSFFTTQINWVEKNVI